MKTVLIIVGSLALISCKKDYMCSCDGGFIDTDSTGNRNAYYLHGEFIIKNVSKKDAKSKCINRIVVENNGLSHSSNQSTCKLK